MHEQLRSEHVHVVSVLNSLYTLFLLILPLRWNSNSSPAFLASGIGEIVVRDSSLVN